VSKILKCPKCGSERVSGVLKEKFGRKSAVWSYLCYDCSFKWEREKEDEV